MNSPRGSERERMFTPPPAYPGYIELNEPTSSTSTAPLNSMMIEPPPYAENPPKY